MADLPENRRKGFKIYDDEGNHICDLAEDVHPLTEIKLKNFTNWSIPQPITGDLIHPAIHKFTQAVK